MVSSRSLPIIRLRGRYVRFPLAPAILAAILCAAPLSLPGLPRASLVVAWAAPPAKNRADNQYGGEEKRRKILNGLFSELKRAKGGFAAQSLIEQIWLNWHQSGRRDVDDLLSRAKINASEGEFAAALRKLDDVNRLAPDFAEGWNGRATVLFQMGRYGESLAAIAQTLKYEPRHFGALAGRGVILFRQEKFQAALRAFEEALHYNPFIAEQHTFLPAIRKKLGIREL